MKSAIRMMLVAGVCLGMLSACAKKPAPLTDETYLKAGQYEFGQSRAELATIEEQIRTATAEQYPQIEDKLLALLGSPQTKIDAKRYVCRYLGVVGSSRAVPALAGLLGDEQLSHPARMALEAMPSSAAGAALRKSMGQLQGELLVGVIGSVGARRDAKAVDALAKLVVMEKGSCYAEKTGQCCGKAPEACAAKPIVPMTAAAALGSIGTKKAADALQAARANAPQCMERPLLRALTDCADRLAKSGPSGKAESLAIYNVLMQAQNPAAQRLAGAKGLLSVSQSADAARLAVEMLNSDDVVLRSAAIAALSQTTDSALKGAVVNQLSGLKPAGQLAVLNLLPDMKDVPARTVVLSIIQGGKDEIRLAAIACLAVHGEVGDVPLLVQLATAGAADAEKAAARAALARLSKPGTDQALLGMIESADAASRKTVLAALAGRHVKAALPTMVKLMNGSDAVLAAQAIDAIGQLGGATELPALAELLASANNDAVRSAAEKAAAAICTQVNDSQATAPVILAALKKASTPAARAALLRLLPRVKGQEALAAIKQATSDSDLVVREAGIRAMAEWPDLSAVNDLLEIARTTDSERFAVLALQGCTRLAGKREFRPNERLGVYEKVLATAKRPQEKKAVIAGLGEMQSAAALDVLAKAAEDQQLSNDAARAALRIATHRNAPSKAQVRAALEKIKTQPLAEDVKKQVDAAIQNGAGK